MSSEGAKKLVEDVIENLLDRRGVGNELEQIDADVMDELKETLAGIGDAAVAPLSDAVSDAPLPDTLDYTNPEDFMRRYKQWHERTLKALEQWRTGR